MSSGFTDFIGAVESPIVSVIDGITDSLDDGIKGVSSVFGSISMPLLLLGGGLILVMVLKK